MAVRAPPASSTPQQGGCDQAPLSNQPGSHRINRRQIIGDEASRIAFVGRTEKFARVGAEINAGRIGCRLSVWISSQVFQASSLRNGAAGAMAAIERRFLGIRA